jgi:hypothetical protein
MQLPAVQGENNVDHYFRRQSYETVTEAYQCTSLTLLYQISQQFFDFKINGSFYEYVETGIVCLQQGGGYFQCISFVCLFSFI